MGETPRRTATIPRRLSAALLLVSLACRGAQPLTHEKARGMIEASLAFQEPVDEDLKKVVGADPSVKREMLKVEALSSKPDGPLGLAGETATVTFTWRWTQGPLAGVIYRSRAKIHGDSQGWKVYDDKLRESLRGSVAGEE